MILTIIQMIILHLDLCRIIYYESYSVYHSIMIQKYFLHVQLYPKKFLVEQIMYVPSSSFPFGCCTTVRDEDILNNKLI